MITKNIIIGSSIGLHARPASVFSKTAKNYVSKVKVTYDNKAVNGKSALQLIALKAVHKAIVTITVDGPDELEAMKELSEILEKNFDTE